MAKKIVISPVTRIEGHAKITIHLDDSGKVAGTNFHVTQVRGFEKFVEGRPYYEMPSITARICGICPISHLLASVKACDAIMAVQIPETAVMLRELLHCGQIVQSHALSFFHLSAPDLLLGMDSDPAQPQHHRPAREAPRHRADGIALRKFGQQVIERLAGERVHPSWTVPGGVNAPLTVGRARRDPERAPHRQGDPAARPASSSRCDHRQVRRGDRELRQLPDDVRRPGDASGATCSSMTASCASGTPKAAWPPRSSGPRKYPEFIGEGVLPTFVPQGAVLQAPRLSRGALPRRPAGAAQCGRHAAGRPRPTPNSRNTGRRFGRIVAELLPLPLRAPDRERCMRWSGWRCCSRTGHPRHSTSAPRPA